MEKYLHSCSIFSSGYSIWLRTHLVVHLQRLSFPFGLEVLCVGVYSEVDLPVEALDVSRVPVLVIQQAAHSNWNTAAAEPWPDIICTKRTTAAGAQWVWWESSFNLCKIPLKVKQQLLNIGEKISKHIINHSINAIKKPCHSIYIIKIMHCDQSKSCRREWMLLKSWLPSMLYSIQFKELNSYTVHLVLCTIN